ncbi:hypothetical protein BV22DRAFT_1132339 [Leucogyrophana mollusca]|uniref:Uncharacterized protein n=1 Tax=Leucogyrophana mollusca TaxID=85980 RepID=A0ACB8B8X9_9AGAM|nr:hypothetical protein BV22DRAFT_1132339 [Leucogyrophana mollusca]
MSSMADHARRFGVVDVRAVHATEIADAVLDEGKIKQKNYHIVQKCWFPESILPVPITDHILPLLKDCAGAPLRPKKRKLNKDSLVQEQFQTGSSQTTYMSIGSQGRAGDGDGDSEILTPEESIVAGFFNVVTEALLYAVGTLLGRPTGVVIPRTKRIAPGLSTVKALGKRKQKKLERSEEKETVEKENEGENGEGESDDEGPFEAALTRSWSGYYSTHAVTGTPLAVKPDLVLSDRGQNSHATDPLAWNDVHMICELSRREWRLDLERTLYGKSCAMFKVQKDRRFVYAISVCDYLVRISMYDRSGAVHTRGYDIHKEPLTLIRVLVAFLYLPPQYLGYDPTVKLVSFPRELHPFLPIVRVGKHIYTIQSLCFSSDVVRGRATKCWCVERVQAVKLATPNHRYVVKDCWTNTDRQYREEVILQGLAGIKGVPTLIKAWTVKIGGSKPKHCDTTSRRRPQDFLLFFPSIAVETRAHRRLLMAPYAKPLVTFTSRRELLYCLIDIIDAHLHVVKRGVLHRDISIDNIMLYEELDQNGNLRRRGLLVDYDYAIPTNVPGRAISPGDRTGTIPFMAIGILAQYALSEFVELHTIAHDIESIVLVLIYICVAYDGPCNRLRTDKPFEETPLIGWVGGNWASRESTKQSQMATPLNLIKGVSSYFVPFQRLVRSLCQLVNSQVTYHARLLIADFLGDDSSDESVHGNSADALPTLCLDTASQPDVPLKPSSPILSNASVSTRFDSYKPGHCGRVFSERELPATDEPLTHAALRAILYAAVDKHPPMDDSKSAKAMVPLAKRPHPPFITEEHPAKRQKSAGKRTKRGTHKARSKAHKMKAER